MEAIKPKFLLGISAGSSNQPWTENLLSWGPGQEMWIKVCI